MKKRMHGKENVIAVIKNKEGKIKQVVKGKNIVTNAGDEYYARLIIGDPSNINTPFWLRLGTGTAQPTKDDIDVTAYIDPSNQQIDAGFPKRNYTNEGNADGGVNVITYKFTYGIGAVIATGISEGAIVDDGTNPSQALNHFLFQTSFDTTADDQLVIFVNHAFVGV